MYASPIFQARSGSTHGYDVANPLRISSDIGTEKEFTTIARQLQDRGMGWLQDIVPNHMAYDTVNPWIDDLLEKGPHSHYVTYFNVNWEYADPRYRRQDHGSLSRSTIGTGVERSAADDNLE